MHEGHIFEPAEDEPELALRHYGRALELLRAGENERAIKELQQVLQYDSDFSEARDRLEELTRPPTDVATALNQSGRAVPDQETR